MTEKVDERVVPARRAYTTLVHVCAGFQPHESALVISDHHTRVLGDELGDVAREVTDEVTHCTIRPLEVHGEEPPRAVADAMEASDVIFCLTSMSMAHSQARFRASLAGARYLSLPGYTRELLDSPALRVDFRALTSVANRLASVLTVGERVRVTAPAGTELTARIDGRRANAAPGWCRGPGSLASPPDAETNIALVEDASEGVIVVDGSIPCPELGLLDAPLALTIQGGLVTDIEGPGAGRLEWLLDGRGDPARRVVAELGIGLNPKARLTGSMLEDEGCLGTVHFGVGANSTIGGRNAVNFHLDHVVRDATVYVDDQILVPHR